MTLLAGHGVSGTEGYDDSSLPQKKGRGVKGLSVCVLIGVESLKR